MGKAVARISRDSETQRAGLGGQFEFKLYCIDSGTGQMSDWIGHGQDLDNLQPARVLAGVPDPHNLDMLSHLIDPVDDQVVSVDQSSQPLAPRQARAPIGELIQGKYQLDKF